MWNTGFFKLKEESNGGPYDGFSSFFLEVAYIISNNISLDKASHVAKTDVSG